MQEMIRIGKRRNGKVSIEEEDISGRLGGDNICNK
jgi:hypothetical protein